MSATSLCYPQEYDVTETEKIKVDGSDLVQVKSISEVVQRKMKYLA